MTDKEAIDYVKSVIKNSEKAILAGQPVNEVRLYTTDKGLEMLKHVVALADREPCEDSISRQAAIKAIWDGNDVEVYTSEFKEILEGLPSVKPKAKTGKWIEKMYDFKYCSAECDNCHQRALGSGSDNGWGYDYVFPDYCPNCGAKMEVEE